MELKYLSEFLEIVKAESIPEASDKLFCSESSLIRHMKTIEEELGQPLFDGNGKKIRLSDYGRRFYPYAEKMVIMQKEYMALMQDMSLHEKEELTIASGFSLGGSTIEKILTLFQKKYPEYRVNTYETSSVPVAERLRTGQSDFAFTLGEKDGPRLPELSYRSMGSIPLVAVLPENSPILAENPGDSLSLSNLQDERFLLFGRTSGLYRRSIRACQKVGFMPSAILTSYQFEQLIELVRQGLGVALVPLPEALKYRDTGIVWRRVLPATDFEVYLEYRRNLQLKPIHKEFLKHIEELQNDF